MAIKDILAMLKDQLDINAALQDQIKLLRKSIEMSDDCSKKLSERIDKLETINYQNRRK